jgi:hypothetical protein
MSSLAVHRNTDVDVGALLLRIAGTKLSKGGTRVDQRVTGGTLERTLDGASTLSITLDDTDRALLHSGVFSRQIDMLFDGLWWRLVKVTKTVDTLSLTFEDRQVAYLRQITTPRKASRSKLTRAEFALSIVREVKKGGGIPFVCPELHVKQKVGIVSSLDKVSDTKRSDDVSPGLAAAAELHVQGASATKAQKQTAERVLDVANSLSADARATVALLEAVIVESAIQNLSGGDRDSSGVLQVRASTARSMQISARDVEQCANAFLTRGFTGRGGAIALAAAHPSWTSGQIAQAVQGSAYPARYDQRRAEAQAFVDAYKGDAPGTTLEVTQIKKLPFQFQRGGTAGEIEDSWQCLQRLASEVQWRCFVSDGKCYFVSETTLLAQKPIATLSEQTLGVDGIDFDVDNGKPSNDATVTASVARHAFDPGSVVILRDCGPANGRWLISTVQRGIFDTHATITLKRATKALPEPANETTSTTTSFGGDSSSSADVAAAGVSGPVADAYSAAKAIDAKRYPYVWAGGHARCGVADGGNGRDPGIGFDCSGSTCAVLAAGGMGYELGGHADVSGTIASRWGEPGKGETMTVYANDVHVFVVFHTAHGDEHFGTGNWGKSWGGAGFNPRMHPLAGFNPRHWPGT